MFAKNVLNANSYIIQLKFHPFSSDYYFAYGKLVYILMVLTSPL